MKIFFIATLVSSLVQANDNFVLPLTDVNFSEYVPSVRKIPSLIKFYAPWCGHCKSMAPAYNELAQLLSKHKEQVNIAEVDCDSHADLCKKNKVEGYPTIKWFGAGEGEPEAYSGGRDLDGFVDFIKEKTNIKVKPSKPQSFVTVLNLSNFDSIVMDPKKYVLVEFYAPWCGHCKNLEPIYEKLAKTFANEKEVVIAKIDADAHKSLKDRFGIKGFPTIKFFPKGENKEGTDYELDRSEEAIVEFLNEKTGTFRKAGGGLNDKAGTLDNFKDITTRFLSARSVDEFKALFTEASEIAKKVGTKDAEYYSKVLSKVQEKGKEYIDTEIARISKMLSSSSLAEKSKDSFAKRKNILSQFLKVHSSEEDSAAEELAEMKDEL